MQPLPAWASVLAISVVTAAACGSDAGSGAEANSDGDESTGDPGAPTPGAPDELCPGSLDPARVYVWRTSTAVQSDTALIFPLDAPEQACAYEVRGGDPFVAVMGGGLRAIGIGADHEGAVFETPQRWLVKSSTSRWHVDSANAEDSVEVASLSCPIGADGWYSARQRVDGDVAFFCADGIGGQWLYDRPGDDTPVEVADWSVSMYSAPFVTPLPGDRWLLESSAQDGIGIEVLQGDGQRIPVVAQGDLPRFVPITGRMTEEGALVVGYVYHDDGSSTVELCELVGEQLTSIAVYEHGMEVEWPFFDDPPGDGRFRPALGADGTLAAVIDVYAAGDSVRQAVWMGPDTALVVAAEGDVIDDENTLLGVFSQ